MIYVSNCNYNYKEYRFPVLCVAAGRNCMSLVDFCLKQPDLDINCRSTREGSALYIACKPKRENIFLKLISHPNINPNIGKEKNTPLHEAAKIESKVIIKKLLEHAIIDINILNEKDESAFYCACEALKESNAIEIAKHEDFMPNNKDIIALCKAKFVEVACILEKKGLLKANEIDDRIFKQQIAERLKVLSSKSARK